jgi:hypothetical protein
MLTEAADSHAGTLDYMRTGNHQRYYPDYPYKWSTNTVVHIPGARGIRRASGELQDHDAVLQGA